MPTDYECLRFLLQISLTVVCFSQNTFFNVLNEIYVKEIFIRFHVSNVMNFYDKVTESL